MLIEEIGSLSEKRKKTVCTYDGLILYRNSIWIHFILQKTTFSIEIFQEEDIWLPSTTVHEQLHGGKCPFCGRKEDYIECDGLNEHIQELFDSVMHHPKVRLRKLFL